MESKATAGEKVSQQAASKPMVDATPGVVTPKAADPNRVAGQQSGALDEDLVEHRRPPGA